MTIMLASIPSAELASVVGASRVDPQEWGVLPIPRGVMRGAKRFGHGLATGVRFAAIGAVTTIGVAIYRHYAR